jgi:hypothetical protein
MTFAQEGQCDVYACRVHGSFLIRPRQVPPSEQDDSCTGGTVRCVRMPSAWQLLDQTQAGPSFCARVGGTAAISAHVNCVVASYLLIDEGQWQQGGRVSHLGPLRSTRGMGHSAHQGGCNICACQMCVCVCVCVCVCMCECMCVCVCVW